ncbi:MAG TPA: hypothetical protein VER03_09070 [Bryobacteraceae bacterium]|nr:hypothetical protein [Bryobacteraceae bacterium]
MTSVIRQCARVLLPALLLGYLALKCWKLFKANNSQNTEELLIAALLVGFLFTIGVIVELSSEKGGPIAIAIALAGIAFAGLVATRANRTTLDEAIARLKATALYDQATTDAARKSDVLLAKAHTEREDLRDRNSKIIGELKYLLRLENNTPQIEKLRAQRDRNYARIRELNIGIAVCINELKPPSLTRPTEVAILVSHTRQKLQALRRAELAIDGLPSVGLPVFLGQIKAHSVVQLLKWVCTHGDEIVVEPIIGSLLTNLILAILALVAGSLNHRLCAAHGHSNVYTMPSSSRRKAS